MDCKGDKEMNELLIVLIVGIGIGVFIMYYVSKNLLLKFVWQKKLRDEAIEQSRSVLKGKIAEQIVPLLKDFKYNLADARFLGAPIDYIIFDGMTDDRNKFNLVFVDVKKGNATLTLRQEKIREAVDSGRIKWETIRLSDKDE